MIDGSRAVDFVVVNLDEAVYRVSTEKEPAC